MNKTIATLGIVGTLAGGVNTLALKEQPINTVQQVASEKVEVKQVGNIVETNFPWKGEKGITVEYDLGKPTIKERVKDKRKKQVITQKVNFDDGGFKVDIILNEKPSTNKFCYTIEGSENYDFFYQPPLTAKEIKEGNSRPDNIVGSYAVYHKHRKNNQYKTGKVMHIPRPQVWEVNNEEATKEWATLSYSGGQLCVTARQGFLDNATYPVRIDPTFGYTSIGASAFSLNQSAYSPASMRGTSITGTLTEIAAYLRKTGASSYKFGIGLEDDVGTPGGSYYVLSTLTGTTITDTTFTLKTYSTSYSLTGLNYWVTALPFTYVDKVEVAYDSGGGDSAEYDGGTGGWVSSTKRFSIYATYTASASAPSITSDLITFD